jgi:toxin ParE1/3/4
VLVNKAVLSVKASKDVKSILLYTLREFGERQSRLYFEGLTEVLEKLAFDPKLGKLFSVVKNQPILRYRFQSHVLFYSVRKGGIFIIRILGGQMDFTRHF